MCVRDFGDAMPLTDLQIRAAAPAAKPYKLRDGTAGLYLYVGADGAKHWRRDYAVKGKRSTASLGTYLPAGAKPDAKPIMSIKDARRAADEIRRMVADGIDPNAERSRKAAEAALAAAQAKKALQEHREAERARKAAVAAQKAVERATVQRVADAWVEASESGWTLTHAGNVRQSLEDHVHPKIGAKPVAEVTTSDVLGVLSEMLTEGKIETATRVFQRLGAVWEWAILKGHTNVDPVKPLAREFSRLKRLARKRNPKRNFAAVSRDELPGLLKAITAYKGDAVTKAAVRLLALTFVRTGELRLATWPEFDLDAAEPTWVIPVERMKIKFRGDHEAEPHIVPLSSQAVTILKDLKRVTGQEAWVLPQSRKRAKPISENAVLYALAGMGYAGRMTGHGFRAVASTLLHEAGWPHDTIEAQLAHEKPNATVAAYDRSQHLQKRREMMQAYAGMLEDFEKERPADGSTTPTRSQA